MSSINSAYSRVRIETPENISFDYELAGPGSRMAAYILDFIIIVVVFSLLSVGFAFIYDAMDRDSRDIALAIWIGIISIFYLMGGYFILFEMVMEGQTPGKKAIGIRVLSENGTSVNLLGSLLRNLTRLVECGFPFQYAIGSLVLIFSKRTQRFGDMLSGTIVVKSSKVEKAGQFRWKPRIRRTGLGIHLSLTEEEFSFLSEYVAIYKKLDASSRNRISTKLVYPIIERNRLASDAQFGSWVKDLEDAKPKEKYPKAEAIMKEVLRYYLTES